MYPPRAVVLRQAREAGLIPGKSGDAKAKGAELGAPRPEIGGAAGDATRDLDRDDVRSTLREFARQRGYHSEREATAELVAAKVWRAVD